MKKFAFFLLLLPVCISFAQSNDIFSIAKDGTVEQLKAQLKTAGKDARNIVDRNQNGLLHFASMGGNLSTAAYLVETLKCDINKKTWGSRPLSTQLQFIVI